MILKASQRGNGRQLATHLLNSYDNERVEVADVRGAVARDPHGALAEWGAQAKGTRCQKHLYSLSVNPDHSQGSFTRQHYLDFIARAEKRIGLKSQPRLLVFHTKEGREHCHVVWSRIDGEAGRAVQIAHDRLKLRSVAREFAREHGFTLPEDKPKNSRKEMFNRAVTHGEKQQQERTGVKPEDLQKLVRAAWDQSQTAEALVKALDAHGLYIARGDKRDYVVIDMYGEVHSLSRQLPGIKAKEFRDRMAAIAPETLRSVEAVQQEARQRRDQWLQEQQQKQDQEKRREQADQRRAELEASQKERREKLDAETRITDARHEREGKALALMQAAEGNAILAARAQKEPRGLRAFLARITGIRYLAEARHRREDKERVASQKVQNDALNRRHEIERRNDDRRKRDLDALDTRERQSLETALKREDYQRLAEEKREAGKKLAPALDVQADFRRAADRETVQEQQHDGGPLPQAEKRDIRPDFARAAVPDKTERAGDSGGPRQNGGENAARFNEVAKAPEEDVDHSAADRSPLETEFGDAVSDHHDKRDIRPDFARAAVPDKAERAGDGGGPRQVSSEIAGRFNDVAREPEEDIDHSSADRSPHEQDFHEVSDPEHEDPARDQDPEISNSLASAFNRRARETEHEPEPDQSPDPAPRDPDRGPGGWER